MNPLRIDRAQRKVAASTDEIYRAFLEPTLLETWLPPEGMRGKVHEIDASPGGGYFMSLYYEAEAPSVPGKTTGHEDRFQVVFDELTPAKRIVQRIVFDAADPSFAGAMKQTWRFVQDNEETIVSVACENVPPRIRPEDHSAGLNSSLENLAAVVERT